MRKPKNKVTWDGKPVSEKPPFGATIFVRRRFKGCEQFLLLRRTGVRGANDWAWTPPSGARFPSEDINVCARRELKEETGLEMDPVLTKYGTNDWFVYLVEVNKSEKIILGPEHDLLKWVSVEQAIAMCKPDLVAAPFRRLAKNEIAP